jgi:hypothetical protein
LQDFYSNLSGSWAGAQTDWTGTYEGTVYNNTAEQGAPVLVEVAQHGNGIYGCFVVHKPLYGSGELEGTANSDQLTFNVGSNIGTLKFEITGPQTRGLGEYQVLTNGQETQSGTIKIHRVNRKLDFPRSLHDFSPEVCPSDADLRD